MRNKKLKLALVIVLALVTLNTAPTFAKKIKRGSTDAHKPVEIYGAAGGVGASISVKSLLKEKMCLTDSCKELGKEMIGLVNLINANENKMYSAIDKIKDKEVKKLRKDYYAQAEDFKKAKDKSQSDLEVMEKDLAQTENKLVDLASKNSCFVNTFNVEINKDKDKLKALMEKYEQEYNKSKSEESSSSSEDDDMDFSDLESSYEYDVEPVRMVYLTQGDLVSWGIPSVPRIPKPRPKTKPKTQAGATEVKDETYKALGSIEVNSNKITESQKDQFLSDLKAGN